MLRGKMTAQGQSTKTLIIITLLALLRAVAATVLFLVSSLSFLFVYLLTR